jgi:predicted 3-demethylubiquinone-9 3-methyltransferase (glyoxalase superfamily)
MKNIIPFLWFESQAEEAARYYAGIFPGGKMGEVTRFPAGGYGPEGSVMTASFEIAGNQLVALNDKLAEGGERQPGGWLRDRYGVSWQVGAPRN